MSNPGPIEPESAASPTPDASPEVSERVAPISPPLQGPVSEPGAEGTPIPAYPAGYPPYPPGYPAYPGYPPQPRPTESSNAIIALVLAIASWVVCPLVPAIVALVFAARADREIAASAGMITGSGLSTASKVVAWINIGIFAAVILVTGAFFVLAIGFGALDAGLQMNRMGNI